MHTTFYRGCWLVLCSFVFSHGLALAASSVDTLYDERFKKRKVLAQAGHKQEQYKLGLAYLRGNQVKVDISKAVYWFEKAATQKHVKAIHKLGVIYLSNRYGKKNSLRAYHLITRAAKKKYGPSQYQLGLIYLEGRGINKNLKAALFWANKAKRNNVYGAKSLITRINNASQANTVSSTSRTQRQKKEIFKSVVDTRNRILQGRWKLKGQHAQHLPSGLNNCTKVRQQIKCLSSQIKTETDTYKGIYRVRSTISDFHKKGEFRVQYRLNYITVLPLATESGEPDLNQDSEDETPKLGWQRTTTKLKCYIIDRNSLKCHSNDLRVERYSTAISSKRF